MDGSTLLSVGLALCGVAVVAGPLVLPVPPLRDVKAPQDLADPDSVFEPVGDLLVHMKESGTAGLGIVLLHGLGASVYSWRDVLPALADRYRVVAYDRPGFGLTSRPLPGEWKGSSPYGPEAQVELLKRLLDIRSLERAVLIGHSAGGTIAVQFALRHPERVAALVLEAPAIFLTGGVPDWLRWLLYTPQLRRQGPVLLRSLVPRLEKAFDVAVYDPRRISPEVRQGYRTPFRAERWDVGLWEMAAATGAANLGARIRGLRLPVLVVAGDDDRIVPAASSRRVARAIPGASFVAVPECGHLVHEEKPAVFIRAVRDFLESCG